MIPITLASPPALKSIKASLVYGIIREKVIQDNQRYILFFSVFGDKQERVTIRFINPLLDAVVDRFGNDKASVHYARVDDTHFSLDYSGGDQRPVFRLGVGLWQERKAERLR